MSIASHRDHKKEQFWRAAIRQWRRSGWSVRAFCEERRLSEPSFYGWRRVLAKRDAEAVKFVPVRVVESKASGAVVTTAALADRSASGLELLLSAGRVLRVGPSFDGPTLRRLLAVLEEGRP